MPYALSLSRIVALSRIAILASSFAHYRIALPFLIHLTFAFSIAFAHLHHSDCIVICIIGHFINTPTPHIQQHLHNLPIVTNDAPFATQHHDIGSSCCQHRQHSFSASSLALHNEPAHVDIDIVCQHHRINNRPQQQLATPTLSSYCTIDIAAQPAATIDTARRRCQLTDIVDTAPHQSPTLPTHDNSNNKYSSISLSVVALR